MLGEDVVHDGFGEGVGDVVAADVAEVGAAAFFFPERPGRVGPAVEGGDEAGGDFLARGGGGAEAFFDGVGGAAGLADDDGGAGGDVVLVVHGETDVGFDELCGCE